jgi:hypothetical protein
MNIPDKIYLQIEDETEVTWCVDRINDTDVEYLRVDRYKSLRNLYNDVVARNKTMRLMFVNLLAEDCFKEFDKEEVNQ